MCNLILKLLVLLSCFWIGDFYMMPVEKMVDCSSEIHSHPPDFKECCGIDSSVGNKIIGGKFTAIDQYPWTALIEYEPKNRSLLQKNVFLCGGVLISSTYVLTVAHCFTMATELVMPKYVRLGEYNTTNDGKDCVAAEGGGIDCSDPVLIIKIKRKILHPDYKASGSKNDIALIELEKPAPYTDFIRPICLPNADLSISPPERLKMVAVGWGVTNRNFDISDVKQHVFLPFVPMEKCQATYLGSKHSPLSDSQICAGGEKNKDSCNLDSGGPLMFENRNRCELVGLISLGLGSCGTEGTPAVYTKVHSFMPWILKVTGS